RVEWFDEPYAVTGADLDACVDAAGLTVVAGDIVLVRTGQMHWLRAGDRNRYADISPGIGLDAVEWLHDHDVAGIANDTHVFEPYPCPGENPYLFPTHMIELRDVGMPQGQQWDLDELAADCAADGVYEFLLAATPLPVTHASGGLVAPTATKGGCGDHYRQRRRVGTGRGRDRAVAGARRAGGHRRPARRRRGRRPRHAGRSRRRRGRRAR